jgi:uroporphyrinogen decarboxylase
MVKLNGKQRLLALLNHQQVDQIPWVPLAGVHFGKLKGHSARSVLTDSRKIVESVVAAKQEYHADGLPIYFDIQVEAEALGCKLVWAEDSPPSVINHPLENELSIPVNNLNENNGRLPLILDTMSQVKSRLGETTCLFGLVTGPLTIAYHLRGNALFFDLVDKPDYVEGLFNYTCRVSKRITELYCQAGMDVIGVIEPVASQISPKCFKQHLLEGYQNLFENIQSLDAYSMFHVCGNATQIIELMCQTGANILSLDRKVHLPNIQHLTEPYGVFLQGNIPVMSHLLNGTPEDIRRYVSNLLKDLPSPNHLILSPGCDLPWNTPIANVKSVGEILRN